MQDETYKLGSATYTRGDTLRASVQADCLRRFVYRFTREHVPGWALRDLNHPSWGAASPVQFDSDRDWLSHTWFAVKKDGTLDERVKHCQSSPTWPDNPELRTQAA